jgi:hypothetical protein
VIACPSCKRRVFTTKDMWHSSFDGKVRCRACGGSAQLDSISRWMIACMIALVMPSVFLYAGVFYSGHFFVLLIVLTLGAWRALSCIGLPFFTLEAASHSPFERKHGIVMLAALIATAIVLDAFMASKFDTDEAPESGRSASAIQQERALSR